METEDPYKEITEALSEIKSPDGSTSLLDHLQKMFETKLELNDDKKYSDLFEDISLRIKQNGYYLNDNLKKEALFKFLDSFTNNIKSEKSLLEVPKKIEPDSEPVDITQVNYVPDYHSLFKQLSWCGVSLGEKESYLLKNSLRNLSGVLQGGNVTFFGKIFGTIKDYYIAEATDIELPAEYNPEPGMEVRKEDGVNRNVFYVTNDLSEPWVELPDVKPSQIVAARKIKYMFTGILNRPIFTNPHFDGQEQHLLHCQIVRIYHGTKLVPSLNHYTIEDQENVYKMLVPNEKPKHFKHEDLVNMKNWIHYLPGILKEGRVNHFIEQPEGSEVDPEEFKKKIIANDPFDKRMKSIVEDNPIIGSSFTKLKICPWKLMQSFEDAVYVNPYIKLLDETQPDFDPLEQKDNKSNYTVICVKSLIWPGAYNFYLGKESYFFYFGNGMKFVDTEAEGSFVYKAFPDLPKDENDFEDQPEPTIPPKEEDPNAEGEEEGVNKEEEKEEENKEES